SKKHLKLASDCTIIKIYRVSFPSFPLFCMNFDRSMLARRSFRVSPAGISLSEISMKFDFHFDERALRKTLSSIQRDVLPKAAAGFLNGIAFQAQQALKDHTAEAFDGHVKFTERAWRVEKAKPNATPTSMFSEVRAQ